jgi:hypothetical protein
MYSVEMLTESITAYCKDYCSESEKTGDRSSEQSVPTVCEDCPLTNWFRGCVNSEYQTRNI